MPFIGLVGDFSGHYGSESSANRTAARLDCGAFNGNFSQYNFLAGPRVSASVGKVRLFAELFARCSPREHRNHEYVFRDRGRGWARLQALPCAGPAFQVDYVHTHLFALPQDNLRFSTGIVLRF